MENMRADKAIPAKMEWNLRFWNPTEALDRLQFLLVLIMSDV